MNKITILTDDDPDGLTSARQILNYHVSKKETPTTLFNSWRDFGVPDPMLAKIIATKPDIVYILDCGSGLEVISQAEKIPDAKVVIIDNHPPTPEANAEVYEEWTVKAADFNDNPRYRLMSSTQSCTAGLVWDHLFSEFDYRTAFNDVWALIGLEGDVAINKSLGKVTANTIYESMPEFKGKLLKPFKKGTKWVDSEYSFLGYLAQLLHNPKRVAYDVGTATAWLALEEMETFRDFVSLAMLDSSKVPSSKKTVGKGTASEKVVTESLFPNLLTVIKYTESWKEEWWGRVFSKGRSTSMGFEKFGLTVVNDIWNLGSAACYVKSGQNAKPWAFINLGTPDIIHISGRLGSHDAPQEEGIPQDEEDDATKAITSYWGGKKQISNEGHIGRWFTRLQELSGGEITGGGLKEAGQAIASKNVPVGAIVNRLARAADAL